MTTLLHIGEGISFGIPVGAVHELLRRALL